MKNNNFSKGYHDHLSYYIENDISPVHQNISNLRNHFDRRSFLYDSLGVNRLMINNSKIFEFGPGLVIIVCIYLTLNQKNIIYLNQILLVIMRLKSYTKI